MVSVAWPPCRDRSVACSVREVTLNASPCSLNYQDCTSAHDVSWHRGGGDDGCVPICGLYVRLTQECTEGACCKACRTQRCVGMCLHRFCSCDTCNLKGLVPGLVPRLYQWGPVCGLWIERRFGKGGWPADLHVPYCVLRMHCMVCA